LTVREAEVYELLVHQGMSDRQIAAALHITLDTVHTHVNRILRKCRAYSRRHLRESVRADSAGVPAAATLLAVDYTRRPTPVPGLAPSRPELAPWGPPAQAPGRVPLAVARYA
jgi:DNA-binding CsgD family transcriptional regulator